MKTIDEMEWADKLPYLVFPSHWRVKITPAFLGAVIRFRVKRLSTPIDDFVSVYFDAHENLGFFSAQPYWEIYPNGEGDTSRFVLGEEADMIKEIEAGLDCLEKTHES